MIRYRRTRRDGNHALVVSAFEALGFAVVDLAATGGGVPDLLVARNSERPNAVPCLVEVKDGAKKWKRHNPKVLERQERFRERWPGRVVTVTCVEDVQRFARGE